MSLAIPSLNRVPVSERGLTIADFLVPIRVAERVSPLLRNVGLVIAGALLIYLTARIAIPRVGRPVGRTRPVDRLSWPCRLLARLRHAWLARRCPLLGEDRT